MIKTYDASSTLHGIVRTLANDSVWLAKAFVLLGKGIAAAAVQFYDIERAGLGGVIGAYKALVTANTAIKNAMKATGAWISGTFNAIWSGLGTAIHTALTPLLTMYNLAKSVVGAFGGGSKHTNTLSHKNTMSPAQGRFGSVAVPSAYHGQVKSLSAIGTRQTDVNGQPSHDAGTADMHHTLMQPIQIKVSDKVLAQTVLRTSLKANALSGAFTAVS